MNRTLAGPQNQYGCFEQAKHLVPIGIQTLDRPVCNLVTILSTLFRLPNECQHTKNILLICLALTYETGKRSKGDMMNM